MSLRAAQLRKWPASYQRNSLGWLAAWYQRRVSCSGMNSSCLPAWNSSAAGAALPTKLIGSIGAHGLQPPLPLLGREGQHLRPVGVIWAGEMVHQATVADRQHIGLEAILTPASNPPMAAP